MSKLWLFISMNVLLMFLHPNAYAQKTENDLLYDFLVGNYTVVGKYPETNDTYTGLISFTRQNDSLKMTRHIQGKTIVGKAWIEEVLADKIKVLRAGFEENGRKYEITYMIDSDLDNYARLTGLVYFKSEKTREPGLEALFITHEFME